MTHHHENQLGQPARPGRSLALVRTAYLPAIVVDLADMEKHLGKANPAAAGATDAAQIRRAIEAVQRPPKRPVLACKHTPALHFVPGEPLAVALLFLKPEARKVNLLYRIWIRESAGA